MVIRKKLARHGAERRDFSAATVEADGLLATEFVT